MTSPDIPLEEVLYVFDSWTLMVKAAHCDLKPGDHVELLDESKNRVGEAVTSRWLSSRNPDINAIAIEITSGPPNPKRIKFVRKLNP